MTAMEAGIQAVETGVEGLAVTSDTGSLGSPSLAFGADSITRSMGSWIEDGFEPGQTIVRGERLGAVADAVPVRAVDFYVIHSGRRLDPARWLGLR